MKYILLEQINKLYVIKNLNIEYKLGLCEGMYVNESSKTKIGVICSCPNENEIYLYGQTKEYDVWLRVLQHEIMHAVLYLVGVSTIDNVHHRLMHAMSEVWEK